MYKDFFLFTTGAIIYPVLEILWRGYSHYSMSIAGGLCLVLINKICCELLSQKRMYIKCIVGSLIITGVELVIGIIFNIFLKMNVWDYSSMPLNILGQICMPFSVVWFFICIPAIYLCKKITYFLQTSFGYKV